MKLEQLQQLVEIEKYGSVSKAAKSMYMAHSTLSNNLSSLEAEIGVRLFERNPMGVTPTSEGKEIIQLARQILSECNQILEYGKHERELDGSVTILLAPAYQFLCPEIMVHFQRQYPKATLHLEVCLPDQIIQDLLQGNANLGLLLASERQIQQWKASLRVEFLGCSNGRLYVGKNHRLANRETVEVEELKDEMFVTYSIHHWNRINEHIKAEPKPFIIENHEVIKRFISNGDAIGYFPEAFISQEWQYWRELIQPIIISNMEMTSLNNCLLYPDKRKLTLLEQNMRTYMRDLVSVTALKI